MTKEQILRSMECVLESDKRTIKNPISEYGWLFDKIYEWKKSLEQEPKWVPVSERLPEENGVYIVSYEDSVRLLEWFNGKWFFYPSNPAREETGTVTAWKPLPKPYMAGSEG